MREGAIAAINGNLNRYTDAIGLLELRSALACKISAETDQPWSADEIAVTSGAKQALFNAALALVNPGDEVLIPAPYWTTFPTQIIICRRYANLCREPAQQLRAEPPRSGRGHYIKDQGDRGQHPPKSDRHSLRPR
ncbi:aminotransferase class I/II-fold pyridoxal phosphate-dependent enzyme [Bradyrhizobium manausense]|uniref:aminotransferase class I/II-fold pyridoxal phosphate-dependent enzyme n=1 Tax=Bradyrhizobium manausense TaxID=989370 RepID=UPI000AB766F2